MNTLITPARVVKLAFTAGESVTPEVITVADIAAAERRWIVPVIGEMLYVEMLDGDYPEILDGYLAPAIALFTRALIQPRLDIYTDRCGTIAPKSPYTQPADRSALHRLRRQLLAQARIHLQCTTDYLEEHITSYSYISEANVSNRCSTIGGIVFAHPPAKGGAQ